ncbi:nitroreductase family protein [Agromyces atrinae]|uniref:Nitroreductase n=1 Tax=Agromyces atrinae TaxID=592376 RepID=A0A4Q2MAC5_9MICO|nr:nitroreductase family protein [Agromyces atrinae]NYD68647.1 nitroreductase [Agromyces atrinae]RXZ86020.1 nitroreductase family protein [Agromyces atrinae]
MSDTLPLSLDELLTTTRAVRKRLDLERPVPIEVIRDALEIALQAPSGGNRQKWHWIIVTDPEQRRIVAKYYAAAYAEYAKNQPENVTAERERILSSSTHLANVIDQVPVLIIGAIDTGTAELPAANQAGTWGSVLPAAWNLALALRARGLGSTWTTLHLAHEREVAEALGLPDTVHQGVLLPVAYTKGVDFKPGPRVSLDDVVHLDRW